MVSLISCELVINFKLIVLFLCLCIDISCREPESGLCLEVHTNQPGVQLYTGNFLSEAARLKGDLPCYKHAGFCLETQAFPNAINQV